MHKTLLQLIEDRGVEVEGKRTLTAQLVLEGGVQVAGTISWTGDHYRALALTPGDPRDPSSAQLVEFHFAGESVRTIVLPADEGMRETYESMFNGRSSRIVTPS